MNTPNIRMLCVHLSIPKQTRSFPEDLVQIRPQNKSLSLYPPRTHCPRIAVKEACQTRGPDRYTVSPRQRTVPGGGGALNLLAALPGILVEFGSKIRNGWWEGVQWESLEGLGAKGKGQSSSPAIQRGHLMERRQSGEPRRPAWCHHRHQSAQACRGWGAPRVQGQGARFRRSQGPWEPHAKL